MLRAESTKFRVFCFLFAVTLALFAVLSGLAVVAPLEIQVVVSAMIVGACIGSFSNVVIWRLPIMLSYQAASHSAASEDPTGVDNDSVGVARPKAGQRTLNLIEPASACTACDGKIECWHNVPIFSFLWLRGRCAQCGSPISLRYPAIEAAFALAYGLLAWHFGLTFALVGYAVLVFGLAVLLMIDWDTQLLPDLLTQPLLWLGLLANAYGLHTALENAVWGAVGGYAIFWMISIAFTTWTGKEGMGHGDFKLMAVLGAWFGWQMLPWIMWIGSALSIIQISASVLMKKRKWGDRQAFGPALIVAGLAVAVIAESGVYPAGFR